MHQSDTVQSREDDGMQEKNRQRAARTLCYDITSKKLCEYAEKIKMKDYTKHINHLLDWNYEL